MLDNSLMMSKIYFKSEVRKRINDLIDQAIDVDWDAIISRLSEFTGMDALSAYSNEVKKYYLAKD